MQMSWPQPAAQNNISMSDTFGFRFLLFPMLACPQEPARVCDSNRAAKQDLLQTGNLLYARASWHGSCLCVSLQKAGAAREQIKRGPSANQAQTKRAWRIAVKQRPWNKWVFFCMWSEIWVLALLLGASMHGKRSRHHRKYLTPNVSDIEILICAAVRGQHICMSLRTAFKP